MDCVILEKLSLINFMSSAESRLEQSWMLFYDLTTLISIWNAARTLWIMLCCKMSVMPPWYSKLCCKKPDFGDTASHILTNCSHIVGSWGFTAGPVRNLTVFPARDGWGDGRQIEKDVEWRGGGGTGGEMKESKGMKAAEWRDTIPPDIVIVNHS